MHVTCAQDDEAMQCKTLTPLLHLQERAYVTGLRAANFVIAELGMGKKVDILQVGVTLAGQC